MRKRFKDRLPPRKPVLFLPLRYPAEQENHFRSLRHCEAPQDKEIVPGPSSLRGTAGAVAIHSAEFFRPGLLHSLRSFAMTETRFPCNTPQNKEIIPVPLSLRGSAEQENHSRSLRHCEAPQEPRQSIRRVFRPGLLHSLRSFAMTGTRFPCEAPRNKEIIPGPFVIARLRRTRKSFPFLCHCEAPQEPWQSICR